ncbi:helix-turn-helix transcriptional regulator [Ruficoccus amylovorans]|uniref:Helix-turn-helix transcriptional regulator n=1 Tax=Ruficoccus amylovorans TaxID=1804625 RepID=A0A842HDY3_9BACT|nr:helix-turn-helix transcriptional regulator [Ruficoccus amylovorans]MBC2593744.1 helix-turn-helix transcriptional regulator [Ruficoccus amylovorans]
MSYHDLTLKDIANHTDSAVSTVGTWKNGRVPPSPETHESLAALFGVSVEYLLYGSPDSGKNTYTDPAGNILSEIELVMEEIDIPSGMREPEERFLGPVRPESVEDSGAPFRRSRIEGYLRQFLDRAEAEPGGLAHTWYHLKREFPLDLFSRLG